MDLQTDGLLRLLLATPALGTAQFIYLSCIPTCCAGLYSRGALMTTLIDICRLRVSHVVAAFIPGTNRQYPRWIDRICLCYSGWNYSDPREIGCPLTFP